ncbi:MAG: hypothetical protein AAF409_15340 [Pseudomonadota bacterium]
MATAITFAGLAATAAAEGMIPGSDRGHADGFTLVGSYPGKDGFVAYVIHGTAYGQPASYSFHGVDCTRRKQVFYGSDEDFEVARDRANKNASFPAQIFDDIAVLDRDEFYWHIAAHVCSAAHGIEFPPYDERFANQ